MQSILSNFPAQRLGNQPKKILHLDFSKVTLGASTFVTTKNYNKTITLSNLNSSVMNSFFGTSYTLQSQSIVDVAVADAAAFDAITSNTIVTVPGPYGANVSALFQNMISKTLTPNTNPSGAPNQTWVRVLRNAPGVNPAENIDSLFVSQWRRHQISPANSLSSFIDYTVTNAQWLALFDFKTGGYGGVEGAGDYRLSGRIEEDATGLYWSVRGDDLANNAAVPGVPDSVARQFWRVDSRIPVPPNDAWYRLDVWVLRHQATTNRTLVTVTLASDGKTYVICDKISSASLAGGPGAAGGGYDAQEGVQRLPWSQIFLGGLYTDGVVANYPCNSYMYDLQVWDKPPYRHGKLEVGNFGPLPRVATPLSRATYYASPTGSSGNPGTFNSPKDIQSAINATVPGDVVFLLAGTYSVTTAAHLNLWQDGTATNPIIYEAYPGHTVIIDGSTITPGVGNQRRVNMSGSYQKLRGVTVQNMPEYGIFIGGNYNTVDGCTVTGNKLSGIITYTSGSGPWSAASYNTIINNWVHHNSDVGLLTGNYNNGGNADGIAPSRGYGNKVQHNLVEYNSDDGIDSWISWSTEISYNVVRYNGLGNGNGNGIKAGGNTEGKNALVQHNLVYGNLSVGIDINTGIACTFKSNTTYDNATGYGFESDTINERNVSIGDTAVKYGTGVASQNSWDIIGTPTFISTTEGNADFLKVTQGGTFDNIGTHYL
jgi:hypothetical protein